MRAAAPVDSGRWVTSWKLWLALLPFSAFSLTSHLLDEVSLRNAALTGLVSTAVSGLVLLVASLTVFRDRRDIRPRSATAILVWLLVGVVTYLTGELITRYLFSAPDSTWHLLRDTTRYSLALVMRTTLAVIGVSALLNTQRELRATKRALTLQRDELDHTEAYLAEMRMRYASFVKESLEPRLHSLMAEVDLLKTSPGSRMAQGILADELEDFGAHQVRLLSHQIVDLAYPTSTGLPDDDVRMDVPTGWSLISGWICEIPPVLPWLLVFVFTRLGYGSFELLTAYQAFGLLAFCVVGWLILTLARILGERTTSIPNRVPAWMGAATLLAIALASVVMGHAFGDFGDSLRMAAPAFVGQVMTTLLLVWIVNFTLVQRGGHQRELEAAVAALEEISRGRDEVAEQLRYRLAGILHGPVQGRLALASMTIRQFVDSSSSDPNELARALATVQRILTSIDQELEGLSAGSPVVRTFEEFIAELQRTWAGVLDVEVRISPAAEVVLAQWTQVRASAVLVAKEAIMNARRHGRARVVFLSVDMHGRGQLQVSVLDDGIGSQPTSGAGLGSRIFNRASSSWSLTNVRFGGSLFNAIIDLPAGAEVPGELVRVG
jgi:signal transduction histidine kinase